MYPKPEKLWRFINPIFPPGSLYANPQNMEIPSDLRDRVAAIVNNPNTDCAEFIKKLIAAASTKGKAFSDDPMKLFDRIQSQAGFKLKDMTYGGLASREGNKRVVYLRPSAFTDDPRLVEHTNNAYAMRALNELMHHSRDSGFYDDSDLSKAIFTLLTPEEREKHPLPRTSDVETNSKYFHPLFNRHCRSITGE